MRPFSQRTVTTVKTTGWLLFGWMVAFLLVDWIVRPVPTNLGRELVVGGCGAIAGLLSAWFELHLIRNYTRTLTVGGLLLSRTFFYVVMLAILINIPLVSLIELVEEGSLLTIYQSEHYRDFLFNGRFLLALVSLTLVSFLINFVRQINRMLGPGTLVNLLLGRYHRPLAEDRIFMFLDLNNSTAIAEQLGPERFNEFKNDFFYDITEPILETRGQIYQYVGDEVVVTWTVKHGLHQGNCFRCFFLMTECIHERKEHYLAQYGVIPTFKAGLHGGTVVTAEIGDIKKDIVHSGDTVNTAARIEAQCRPLNRQVLVSEGLLAQCQMPAKLEVEDMGAQELRGKAQAVRLYSIRPRT